ncbi:MAG: V-type ATP synthase subunit F [Acidilobus sp.]
MSASETKVLVIGDEQSLPLFRMIGLSVMPASSQAEAEEVVRKGVQQGYSLIVVLKHIVTDEEKLRRIASEGGAVLLTLPTKWSKAEPINIEMLLAQALGLG